MDLQGNESGVPVSTHCHEAKLDVAMLHQGVVYVSRIFAHGALMHFMMQIYGLLTDKTRTGT